MEMIPYGDFFAGVGNVIGGAARKIATTSGRLVFFGSVSAIVFTATGYFITITGALLLTIISRIPVLPEPFMVGISFFPVSTLAFCITFLIGLKGVILAYTLVPPFMVFGASVVKRFLDFDLSRRLENNP